MSDLFSQPEFQADDSYPDEDDLAGDDAGSEATQEPESSEDGNALAGGAARAVLEHVSRSLVDDSDAVVVEVSPARHGVKLSLHVDPSDMGRVIGRRGRTAQAIRTLVRAAAASQGTDAIVDIVD